MKTNTRKSLNRNAGKLLSGLNKNSNLPVTHVTPNTLESALALVRAQQVAFDVAKAATRQAQQDQAAVVIATRSFAEVCRDNLIPVFGNTWNVSWSQAGWTANSLSVPSSAPELAELFHALTNYLTDHPQHERTAFGVTAAAAELKRDGVETAIQSLRNARSAQRQKRETRDTAEDALRDKMRALLNELKAILKPEDPRWMDFVDEVPADEQRPEPVAGVTVASGEAGELEVNWQPSARAERYQVEILVIGQDTEFRRVETVHDSDATLTDLTPGAQVKVRVVAANITGESAPSAEVSATVPGLARVA